MRTFKIADCIVQALTFVAVLAILASGRLYLGGPLFDMYFVVGGVQVLSMLVHFGFPAVHKIRLRRVYHVLLILTIVGGIISYFLPGDGVLGFLAILLLWSPVLAIMYFICCVIETDRLKRPAPREEPAS